MKRLFFSIAVIAMVATGATPAGAAPDTAADFAADCNADGLLQVSGNQRYRGGTGGLVGPCVITMEVGSRLVLRGVTLTGDSSLAILGSLADTTVEVVDSTIEMDGSLELTAGCCAGDSEVPEQNGRVVIRRSVLRGSAIAIVASFDWPDGVVVVSDSTMVAGAFGITIRASDLAGIDGNVKVRRSTLNSADDLLVRTGTGGTTRVRDNDATGVAGTATVTAGPGGTCRSTGNVPALPCS